LVIVPLILLAVGLATSSGLWLQEFILDPPGEGGVFQGVAYLTHIANKINPLQLDPACTVLLA
jgi:hypothetical protein